jgi:hypothetical protein
MDKKDKVLLVIAPVAVIVGGYLMFGEKLFPPEAAPVAEESFTSIEAPVTENRKKRTEIYRDKYEKENGEKYKRKIENDDSFFGEEIKDEANESSTTEVTAEENQLNEAQPSVAETKKEKPKVIVKYVERPVKSENSTATVANTSEAQQKEVLQKEDPKKQVRRTGFVSGSSTNSATAKTEEEVSDVEINIPVVVQEGLDAKAGSNIQLRTLEETQINGVKIAKNTLITGVVGFAGERVTITVKTLKGSTRSVSMKLLGYDSDGNEGMPLEGGVDKQIKKDIVGDVIERTGTVVKIPIVDRIPIKAGEKKVNDPSVPIPKGYKLYLKPEVK